MSDDAKVAKELVETLKDGERGFASAAEKLRDSDRAEWATTLQRLSEQRAGFRSEIVAMGHEYGDDVDESGSAAAALHRGWISLKDALTGDDAGSVLGAAVTGRGPRGLGVREGREGRPQRRLPRGRRPPARRHRGGPRRGQGPPDRGLTRQRHPSKGRPRGVFAGPRMGVHAFRSRTSPGRSILTPWQTARRRGAWPSP